MTIDSSGRVILTNRINNIEYDHTLTTSLATIFTMETVFGSSPANESLWHYHVQGYSSTVLGWDFFIVKDAAGNYYVFSGGFAGSSYFTSSLSTVGVLQMSWAFSSNSSFRSTLTQIN
jgi:hypothetical protein